MFYSLTVAVKVSLLVPGLWKTRSSMFLSPLTAGVDNIIQTGVFGMKVRSTRAKVYGGYVKAQNAQQSAEERSKKYL